MLNEKNERELAYVVKINEIKPIEGADRVEIACINGWRVMVRKGQFQPGNAAVYFEIDSKVPEEEPFLFLAPKHFKVKTQKYFKGTVVSQGLLMAFEDFIDKTGKTPSWLAELELKMVSGEEIEGTFLTKEIGVTYAVEEDNKRKAGSFDKYKKMAQRCPDIFKHKWAQWFMRRDWGKKFMFLLFGRKKDKKNGWPAWVAKTDEERVQNMPWILENKEPWIATEKIDGTSTTFTYKKNKFKKDEFYVCSRNVVFSEDKKDCFYDTNVYVEMAEKYNIKEVLKSIVKEFDLEWVTLQGETYGAGIQNRDYGMKDHDFCAFNLIFSTVGRLNSVSGEIVLKEYNIPWVPIISEKYILPDTVEEILQEATGESKIDGKMREGIVFRSADGLQSFKAVSNEFLMKYHS